MGAEWAGLAGVPRRAGVGERAQAGGQAQLAERWPLWALTAEGRVAREWDSLLRSGHAALSGESGMEWPPGLGVLYFSISTPW